jgi:hypothetical protein
MTNLIRHVNNNGGGVQNMKDMATAGCGVSRMHITVPNLCPSTEYSFAAWLAESRLTSIGLGPAKGKSANAPKTVEVGVAHSWLAQLSPACMQKQSPMIQAAAHADANCRLCVRELITIIQHHCRFADQPKTYTTIRWVGEHTERGVELD